MATLELVLDALKYGWSIIPVAYKRKTALVKWTPYMNERASEDQVRRWWAMYPNANYAILCGKISNLFVIDVDGPPGVASWKLLKFPPTSTVKTGREDGYQLYYQWPGSITGNSVKNLPGIDIRTDGGYVVGPGSTHETGKIYCWEDGLSPDIYPMQPISIDLINKIVKPLAVQQPITPTNSIRFTSASEGQRNDLSARLTGYLISRKLYLNDIWEIIRLWNCQNTPPLDEKELRSTVESIWKRAPQGDNAKSGFSPRPIEDVLAQTIPAIEYLWKPYIETNGITLLTSPPKEGKSTFSAYLARGVINGELFLGTPCRQGKVLFIELEEPLQRFHVRCNVVGVKTNAWLHLGQLQANESLYQELERFIPENGVRLVVINSMTRYMDIDDENNSRQIEQAIEPLLDLRNKVDCAFLIIHHANKEGKVRGSTHIQAMVDTLMYLRKLDDDDQYGPRELLAKGRDSDIPSKITFKQENGVLCLIANKTAYSDNSSARKWVQAGFNED